MKRIVIIGLLSALFTLNGMAQGDTSYIFTKVFDTEASPVKNQSRSGTCWSFASTSFLESELLRTTGNEYDISEIFFVYYAYLRKAEMMQRYRGKANFSPGGQAHDVMHTIREQGMMPESAFSGLKCSDHHDHLEMDAALNSLASGLTRMREPSTQMMPAIAALLGVYIGTPPEKFEYNKKEYTPDSFAKSTGIDPDDYIELTSYNHHPFYSEFMLEVPDNWSFDLYYNLPLEDLMLVMEKALSKGYSICWDGDVSEEGFSHKHALALVPIDGAEPSFNVPAAEAQIGQSERQEAFDKFKATDDHLMHITAMVSDQQGTKYFVTKNSWGEDRNDNGGYLNMSEAYFRLNTIAIMVHKDAIPSDIRKKLGI